MCFSWEQDILFGCMAIDGFIIFQGKEYVRLKWANKKQEEWVEKSEYIQEQTLPERKCQKPEVLTSNKIGESLDNPSERKENVGIVLSDKQETYLHEIYHRMPNVAEQVNAQGFHNDAFNMVLQEIVLNYLWIFGLENLSVHIKRS